MIRSMTAFASAECETAFGNLSIELRSVNHRYLEISPRTFPVRIRTGSRLSQMRCPRLLRL